MLWMNKVNPSMMGRRKLCWIGWSFMNLISWVIVEIMTFNLIELLDAYLRFDRDPQAQSLLKNIKFGMSNGNLTSVLQFFIFK